MAEILLENIEPKLLEKLEMLAQQHGRSLQAELKHILEQVTQTEIAQTKSIDMSSVREKAARIRQQLTGQIHTDSAQLLREDRDR